MKRTFIAIDIPLLKGINKVFDDFTKTLKDEKIKWADKNHLHITLKFLGDTEEAHIPKMVECLINICRNHPVISLKLKSAGIFKNLHNPRVIWLGTEENIKLQLLRHAIDENLTGFGYEPEEKEFKPHLTLGRIRGINNITALKQLIAKYQNIDMGECTLGMVVFYESLLTRNGPIYKTLQECILGPESL